MAEMIELTDAEWDTVTKTARTAAPSPYLDNVKNAVVGKNYAVAITEDEKSRTIVNNLHKAAKDLKLTLQVVVREKNTPPLVAWRLAPKPTETTPVSEEAAK